MTVAEYIFDFLEKHGTNTVFMVSGSSAMWLTDALARNKNITKVCNLHEQAAVMAADCYSKVNNRPGAVMVTVGPGAMNAITGIAEAFVDSSSVFIVSGQVNSRLLAYQEQTGIRQDGTQGVNLRPIVSSITKYFAVIDAPEKAVSMVARAYYEATHGRKGPVWLDVPVNVQNMQIPESAFVDALADELPQMLLTVPEQEIQDIADRLANAERPLIFAGQGVRSAGAENLLQQLCQQFDVPVVISRMGIDVVPSDSEYFAGRPGAYGNRSAHFALQNADFLLVLGCRLAVSAIGYYPDRLAQHAYKVQVDLDEKELAKTSVPINKKIQQDAKALLTQLLRQHTTGTHEAWRRQCKHWSEQYPAVTAEQREAEPLNTYAITEELARQAAPDAVVVVDTGTVCNVVSQAWQLKAGQRYLISGGLSCMGYWASAIGACYADVPRQVIAITGDGSLQMNIQEFGTLAQYQLPLKLFVYNGYLLIKHNQHNYMHDRFLGVNPASGVYVPDVAAIASAYGLQHLRIAKRDEIADGIARALRATGPFICEVVCDDFQAMVPRLSSRVMPDGSLKASEFDDLYPFLPEAELQKNRLV